MYNIAPGIYSVYLNFGIFATAIGRGAAASCRVKIRYVELERMKYPVVLVVCASPAQGRGLVFLSAVAAVRNKRNRIWLLHNIRHCAGK